MENLYFIPTETVNHPNQFPRDWPIIVEGQVYKFELICERMAEYNLPILQGVVCMGLSEAWIEQASRYPDVVRHTASGAK